jgi:hypothetical protein
VADGTQVAALLSSVGRRDRIPRFRRHLRRRRNTRPSRGRLSGQGMPLRTGMAGRRPSSRKLTRTRQFCTLAADSARKCHRHIQMRRGYEHETWRDDRRWS